jgi:glucose/arabinose dehydrogenase
VPRKIRLLVVFAAAALLAGGATAALNCMGVRRVIGRAIAPVYKVQGDPSHLEPVFEGADATRERIAVSLTTVASGFDNITDVQFVPGDPTLAVVLEQGGKAKWASLADRASGELLSIEVLTVVEEGLLGLAFHPRFAENGKLYLNYVADRDGRDKSVVSEWRVPPGADLRKVKPAGERTIMEVIQPYPNHNAGQLTFGPDGYLYVGWGDGGSGGDPDGHGQDAMTMLGSMLRVDVDRDDPAAGKAYAVPADNPFVGRAGFLPETWAWGLRNPWRYSFDPRGRLIVADVGQNKWEEIDIVERGKNYGWNVREARHCFKPEVGCKTDGLSDPIYEYGREEGQSVTGGYVYTGEGLPALRGKYVFADFVVGRLWAIDLPDSAPAPGETRAPLAKSYALGKWPIVPSTLARDAAGEIYVADFASGKIFRIDPARQSVPQRGGGR